MSVEDMELPEEPDEPDYDPADRWDDDDPGDVIVVCGSCGIWCDPETWKAGGDGGECPGCESPIGYWYRKETEHEHDA